MTAYVYVANIHASNLRGTTLEEAVSVEPEDNSSEQKQSSVQTLAEACGQLDHSSVAQQLHNVPHPVVDCGAVSAAREVALNAEAQFRRDIALQVVGQLTANLIAIDLHDFWFL